MCANCDAIARHAWPEDELEGLALREQFVDSTFASRQAEVMDEILREDAGVQGERTLAAHMRRLEEEDEARAELLADRMHYRSIYSEGHGGLE